ncbi:MAG: class I SAM-dependent methyltransferase [Bacteroidales bacterium]|jgi:SAM-dependent methyltransferase|nr:class I SAM-dependent methyltransferase [Bacteroidales bacterium]
MTPNKELIKLYEQTSKHSNYQILPDKLRRLIGDVKLNIHTRYEKERLNYMLANVSVADKTIVDIGANTGYFSFEMLEAGAKKVLYYEGNKQHANFVKLAAEELKVRDKIEVNNEYFNFFGEFKQDERIDIIVLLNVLHHVGDDYGDKQLSLIKAKQEIARQLNYLYDKTKILIFQLGFNWQGNRNMPLFENGTKSELISFIEEISKDYWQIIKTGIAERNSEGVRYVDLNENNIQRDDSLGEFLNRPLFILKSTI